ncbi:MAG: DUF4365 domain-containing protein [Gemmataceae bacterium]|nr:DUF4365 domain-containing protein [Gemmataceae bacterium]
MSDDQPKRKVRTRGHVIADLAVNFVERQILLAGFTMERTTRDYGLDTHMTTYGADGQVENETVWFQVKSSDHAQISADGNSIGLRLLAADLRYWLLELMPVVVVFYDASTDRAYWVDVQEYASQHDLDAEEIGESVTLRIPTAALFNVEAVRAIRERKEAVRAELRKPGP